VGANDLRAIERKTLIDTAIWQKLHNRFVPGGSPGWGVSDRLTQRGTIWEIVQPQLASAASAALRPAKWARKAGALRAKRSSSIYNMR
jgi:hypothetical protein